MKMKEYIKSILREGLNTLNKRYSKLNMNTTDVFNMIDYHDSYRNLYPDYDNRDNEYEEDYYFNSKEDAFNQVNDILSFFNNFPETIKIYRTIKVKSLKDINYGWLGESWSYDKESAINFAKNHGRGNVLLIAKVHRNNVDWKSTLRLHFQFSRSETDEDENELNIIDAEKIFDVKAIPLNNRIDEEFGGKGEFKLPDSHKAGMRVPKGGSSCASCKFLSDDKKHCLNEYWIEWNGGDSKLPLPADEYCSDWYVAKQ